MGGKPPTIQEVLDIPLPRPRDAEDVDTEAFLTSKRRIRSRSRYEPRTAGKDGES
jgi:hypothetical protein